MVPKTGGSIPEVTRKTSQGRPVMSGRFLPGEVAHPFQSPLNISFSSGKNEGLGNICSLSSISSYFQIHIGIPEHVWFTPREVGSQRHEDERVCEEVVCHMCGRWASAADVRAAKTRSGFLQASALSTKRQQKNLSLYKHIHSEKNPKEKQ